MSELIDRYVHQVGLYVRPKDRAEIEKELRSQIQDQIEDRYGDSPDRTDIAAALKHLGDPRTMAASYSGEQSLVGPELYPFLMTVLRFGLPLVPAVIVIANIVGAALSPDDNDWVRLLLDSIFTGAQAALIFFAIAVIFFAILERSGEEFRDPAASEFNPLELPAVDDPAAVDRFESGIGIAIGMLFGIAILYFLQVGGLTLRFDFNNPGDVLPVPTGWLIVLFFTTIGAVFLNLWALIRRRWTLGTWLVQTLLDLTGAVGVYFVLLVPVTERLSQAVPELRDVQLENVPAILTVITVVLMVIASGSRLIRLWQQRQGVKA